MNIFVLSDTHGNIGKAIEMYERLSAGINFDLIIHCGDFKMDALRLGELLKVEVVSVRGNCDGARTRDIALVEAPSTRIAVTHGHMEDVKLSKLNLKYLAQEKKCSIVCYGHTHRPENEVVDGVRLFNPGSISLPRDGTQGSVGIIVSDNKHTACSVVYY